VVAMTMPNEFTTTELRDSLERSGALSWNWGDAYFISWSEGWFIAQRRDDRSTFRRRTAEDLRDALLNDYSARPMPR
jgi:hypothetical protein